MKSFLLIAITNLIISTCLATPKDNGINICKWSNATISMKLSIKKSTNATVTIYNNNGVVVSTQIKKLKAGVSTINITDVSNLLEGTYTVTVVTNTKTVQSNFLHLNMQNL